MDVKEQLPNPANFFGHEKLLEIGQVWRVGDRVTFTQAGLETCDPAVSKAEINGTVIEVIDSKTVRVRFDNGETEKWAAFALAPGTPNPDAIDALVEAEEIKPCQ